MLLLSLLLACGDVTDPDHDHDNEVITTVTLRLQPDGGGAELTFSWSDPEGDGSPAIDPLVLDAGLAWDVSVHLLNAAEDPAEDLTAEIADEDGEHQLFFTGSAVAGPATGDNPDAVLEHAYADADAAGAPVGLFNRFTAREAGVGDLVLTLRHLPPEDGTPTKSTDLAEAVATGGFGAIPGDNDVQVTFPVDVR